jgi:hypothetical protein
MTFIAPRGSTVIGSVATAMASSPDCARATPIDDASAARARTTTRRACFLGADLLR